MSDKLNPNIEHFDAGAIQPSSASDLPPVSLITICKNRLHHLKETLPWMMKQSATEVIVVDYGCEQGTSAWVNKNYPAARVVEVTDDPKFCAARARNSGASWARGDVLFFVDADMKVKMDLGKWAVNNVVPGAYFRAPHRAGLTYWGTFMCRKEDFLRMRGFDEAYRTWGGEDSDLFKRFLRSGMNCLELPISDLESIDHGDEERQLEWAPNRVFMSLAHSIYFLAKMDVTQITGQEPDLQWRISLKELIDEQVKEFAAAEGKEKRIIKLNINNDIPNDRRGRISRQLAYTLEAPEGGYDWALLETVNEDLTF
jgi:hypothetical protein